MHSAFAANKIVVSGDSAGAGLSLSLIQLILQFQRSNVQVHWYGKEYSVPLPAGVATLSAWIDVSRSFSKLSGFEKGSEDTCLGFDYLPSHEESAKMVWNNSEGWNEDIRKERGQSQLYAPDLLIHNPLVSPLLADSWKGAPPVYATVGDECLRDQNLYLAHRLLEEGVKLRFEKYTAMPHVFQGMLAHHTASERAWESVGMFVKHVTGLSDAGEGIYRLERIHPKTLVVEEIPREELKVGGLEFEAVKEMVKRCVVLYRERLSLVPKKEEPPFVAKI